MGRQGTGTAGLVCQGADSGCGWECAWRFQWEAGLEDGSDVVGDEEGACGMGGGRGSVRALHVQKVRSLVGLGEDLSKWAAKVLYPCVLLEFWMGPQYAERVQAKKHILFSVRSSIPFPSFGVSENGPGEGAWHGMYTSKKLSLFSLPLLNL